MASLLDKFLPPPDEDVRAGGPTRTRTMLEALGATSRNVESFVASGQEVGDSRDLNRILELPRRLRPNPEEFANWRIEFDQLNKHPKTCVCRSRYNKKCPEQLNELQTWGLHDLKAHGGLVGAISVGDGKTLLDLLAAMVVPDCKVAVLLIPPQLRAQMQNFDWEFYGQHWQLPNLGNAKWRIPDGRPTLHIIAYSELSSAKNSDILERIKPDLIIADEAHLLRNATTARTKRFLRFFKDHPGTRFCCWSGTLTSKSIRDYAHLCALALRDGSPLPLHYPTVEEWAGAIDPSDWPNGIGELKRLCAEGEHVREGFRRRFAETPGVVTSPPTMSCTASLTFTERKVVAPKAVHDALHKLYTTWQRPDDEELITGLDVARCAKEISAGFYYRWTWPRGETVETRKAWLECRKEWHKEMREKLKQSKEFMDSPLLLLKAAIRWHDGYTHIRRDSHGNEEGRKQFPPGTTNGPLPVWDSEVWPRWRTIRDTAQPETEGVWIDDFLARDAALWCSTHVGICWYEHDLFGRRVAELSSSPLYGPGTEASARITKETGTRSVVASIRAHGTGKNLQMFFAMVFANTPSGNDVWEQALGRSHRQGQEADEVRVEVYRHTPVVIEALDKARVLAQYVQETMGGSQKLLIATFNFAV